MRLSVATGCALLAAGCTSITDQDSTASPSVELAGAETSAIDDGTYLAAIDPLGGGWVVESVGDLEAGDYESWINFTDGGFLNHGGRCGGGAPAFYRIEGARIAFSRFEEPQYGKCDNPRGIAFDKALTNLLDRAVQWEVQQTGDTAILRAADGTAAVLKRPPINIPELHGRWNVVTLDDKKFDGRLQFGNDGAWAYAGCNTISFSVQNPAPGRLRFGDGIQTLMGCGKESEARDARLGRAIAAVTSWSIADNGELVLAGGPGLRLRRPSPAGRVLAGEYEHCGNTMLGAFHAGPVTLTISGDIMTDNARCTARYTAEGPDLSVTLGNEPACAQTAPPYSPREPIEIGGELSPLALATPDGWGFTEDGVLKLRTPRGLLNLCRKSGPRPVGSG